MSNYPAGMSLSDPHFGPTDEIEMVWECRQCDEDVDGVVLIWGDGYVSFVHHPGNDEHQDDITDEWYAPENPDAAFEDGGPFA